jgi:siroheme synthase
MRMIGRMAWLVPASFVHRSDVKAPTLIIIGEVVGLRERLNWFHPGAASQGPA